MNAQNQDGWMDFLKNPSLGEALADKHPGDTFKFEAEAQVLSIDPLKGLSFNFVPGTVVPDGFELEDKPELGNVTIAPSPTPPGSLAQEPVSVLTTLRRKGQK